MGCRANAAQRISQIAAKFAKMGYENNFVVQTMTSVALSPKFQIVIPKDVRKTLKLFAGQRLEARVVGDKVELLPEIPVTALRGMCLGMDTDVPNDPEPIALVAPAPAPAPAKASAHERG